MVKAGAKAEAVSAAGLKVSLSTAVMADASLSVSVDLSAGIQANGEESIELSSVELIFSVDHEKLRKITSI